MTDLAAIHAGQQSILRALAANGEVLQAILEEITKPQKPSEVAEALMRMAQTLEAHTSALDANTAATERLVERASGKDRINGRGVA